MAPREHVDERRSEGPRERLGAATVRRRVVGMDCANDAAAVERAVRGVPGVAAVRVSSATQIVTATLTAPTVLPDVERAVAGLGYHLEPLDGALDAAPVPAARAAPGEEDDLPRNRAAVPSGFRRALAIVVVLNLGYGVVETVGGFLAESQALKADALDFVGDGLVTGLALLAIRWSLTARARVALGQGVFLLLMSLGVFANTLARVVAQRTPEAEMMGAYGAVALVVNVLAAVVLVPYRKDHDASARAVWRFSAADAAGNAATVAAAGLVAWLGSPWPDLVVALVVGGLFFRSAWMIIRDARTDLREAGEARVDARHGRVAEALQHEHR